MVDSGVHHMAALRVLLGRDRPVRARAATSSRPSSASAPDTVVGSIGLASGVECSVSLTLSSVVVRLSGVSLAVSFFASSPTGSTSCTTVCRVSTGALHAAEALYHGHGYSRHR